MGDGNYRGPARAGDSSLMTCVPYTKSANAVMCPDENNFNSQHRRFGVVAESTIGRIKKWKTIVGKAFRHERDFDNEAFDVCARVTARVGAGSATSAPVVWIGPRMWWCDGKRGWGSTCGWTGSYLIQIRIRGEDYVYGSADDGTALTYRTAGKLFGG